MTIMLLPNWNTGAKVGAQAIVPPNTWNPQAQDLEARALPTPFAQARRFAHLLSNATSISAEDGTGNRALQRFRDLVLGLCLGELRLELVDLERSVDADNFGKALARVDKDSRFLGMLRRPSATASQSIIFGATDAACLLWPHPRRSDDQDWASLRSAIASVPGRESRAYALLADWRATLQSEWAPTFNPWMRALDLILGTPKPSPNHFELRDNSRLEGPVRLYVGGTEQLGGKRRLRRIYFPVLSDGRARAFFDLCGFSFTRNSDATALDARDSTGKLRGSILRPQGQTGGDQLLLGWGNVRMEDTSPEVRSSPSDGFLDGLPSLLTEVGPLRKEFEEADRAEGVPHDPASRLAAYPDAVRFLFRVGDLFSSSPLVSYSRQALLGLRDSNASPLPGLQEARRNEGPSGPRILEWETQGVHHAAIYTDDDVLALGYVLFSYFCGTADLSPNVATPFARADRTPLTFDSDGRPIDAVPEVYALIKDSATLGAIGRRLATLQRFVRTYSSAITEASGNDPAKRLSGLRGAAARRLAAAARGDAASAIELGSIPGIEQWASVLLPRCGLPLRIARDALLSKTSASPA